MKKNLLTWAGFVVFPPLVMMALQSRDLMNGYYYQVIMMVGINAIMAMSLNLVNGFNGQFSLGHAGLMGIGAYTAAVLTSRLTDWPFLAATLAGGLASALVAYLVGYPSFRTRGDYLAVITLGLNMIIVNLANNIDYIGGPRGFPGIIPYTNFIWIWGWVVVCVVVIRNLILSGHGRAIISVRESEVAAELGGIPTLRYKLLAFSLSGFFAGVAGSLSAHMLQFIAPQNFSIFRSFDVLIMLYLGGVGSTTGSFIGAGLWTVLLEVLRPLGVWRLVLGPLLLVALMLLRRKGILGQHEIGILANPLDPQSGRGSSREEPRRKSASAQ
jgi:branched-chain amino acid transport system permease protein